MSQGGANSLWAVVFVEELVRSGLRHAVVCPGSRSTPLAVALAAHDGLRVWMHLDERSAAFFALGMAKATRQPVALLCTSGTAAANFLPAVVEARYARVPLLVLTADRPPELRDVGAPQAIDQTRLYGEHAKWYYEPAPPDIDAGPMRSVRALACRAYGTALAEPAGSVHLNLPFREPFLPEADEAPVDLAEGARPDGAPYVRIERGRLRPTPGTVRRLAAELSSVERGLIVCGPQDDPDLPAAVVDLAATLGFPVLADPLSGMRAGLPEGDDAVLDAYDAFLRDESWIAAPELEVVLRFGGVPTSKPLAQYLARRPDARQVVVDAASPWRDPAAVASDAVYADPVASCRALADELADGAHGGTGRWAEEWRTANGAARAAIRGRLAELQEPFEGKVFAELAELLPDGSTLFVGNSMPIRDLDAFVPATRKEIRILGNRGANGIDGVTSSALGASAVASGPTVLVVGDLSFLHDQGGLLAAKLHGLDLTIVLLNNDGGGIFSFLPQAGWTEHFEQLFGTPHGLDLAPAVALYGGSYARAEDWPAFREAVSAGVRGVGLHVVELRTERRRNVELHREMWRAVSEAVRGRANVGGTAEPRELAALRSGG